MTRWHVGVVRKHDGRQYSFGFEKGKQARAFVRQMRTSSWSGRVSCSEPIPVNGGERSGR